MSVLFGKKKEPTAEERSLAWQLAAQDGRQREHQDRVYQKEFDQRREGFEAALDAGLVDEYGYAIEAYRWGSAEAQAAIRAHAARYAHGAEWVELKRSYLPEEPTLTAGGPRQIGGQLVGWSGNPSAEGRRAAEEAAQRSYASALASHRSLREQVLAAWPVRQPDGSWSPPLSEPFELVRPSLMAGHLQIYDPGSGRHVPRADFDRAPMVVNPADAVAKIEWYFCVEEDWTVLDLEYCWARRRTLLKGDAAREAMGAHNG